MAVLTRNWWALVLRGAAAIVFGVLAFFLPHPTLRLFVTLLGVYLVVDGVLSIAAAPRRAPGEARWPLVQLGALSTVTGFVVLLNLRASAVLLLYLAAAWAVATGVASLVAAVALRKVLQGEWLLALSGALSIALGLGLVTRPAAGILGFVWAIALYAVMAGVTLVAFGLRLRGWERRRQEGSARGRDGATAREAGGD
jgi:uncharacterized membrane protein HdeD (DUF308 family)